MSEKNLHIKQLKKEITKVKLSQTNRQFEYGNPFYNHLNNLFGLRLNFTASKTVNYEHFDKKVYDNLKQFTFENSSLWEKSKPKEIDWDLVDDAKDVLEEQIKKMLKHEAKSDFLKPIVEYTISSYEDWLIYESAHPNTKINPCQDLKNIFEKGYLYFSSDDEKHLKEYKKDFFKKKNEVNKGNLGLITKSTRKGLFGLVIDHRHSTQSIIYAHLKDKAQGHNCAKTTPMLCNFLADTHQIEFTENKLKNNVLIPLKRQGLIGSNSNGYFFINSVEDLRKTHEYHVKKWHNLEETLFRFESKAEKQGLILSH